MLTNEKARKLIWDAKEAMKNAYTPYGEFPVGAAVLCRDGFVARGCNIENVSFGLTICAERVAVLAAAASGWVRPTKPIRAIAVVAEKQDFIVPCGACLQVIAEFADKETVVITTNSHGFIKQQLLSELLPQVFVLKGS